MQDISAYSSKLQKFNKLLLQCHFYPEHTAYSGRFYTGLIWNKNNLHKHLWESYALSNKGKNTLIEIVLVWIHCVKGKAQNLLFSGTQIQLF